MAYNENNASFTFDNIVLVCRPIDGKIELRGGDPQEEPQQAQTSTGQTFLSTIRRVSIFSNKTTHQVKLHINGSQLAVSAEDLTSPTRPTRSSPSACEGEEMFTGNQQPVPRRDAEQPRCEQ